MHVRKFRPPVLGIVAMMLGVSAVPALAEAAPPGGFGMMQFVLLMGGLGLLVAVPISGWFLYTGYKARRLANESQRWPTAQAKVLASTVEEVVRRGSRGSRSITYRPVVRYEYVVAGTRYEGNVIQFGLTEVGRLREAEGFIKDRPVGVTVPVSVNPGDPTVTTLDTSNRAANWRIWSGWIVLFAVPALLAAVAVLAAWLA